MKPTFNYIFIDCRLLIQLWFGYSLWTTTGIPQAYNSKIRPTCVVYDETPPGQALLDDLSGNPCSLLSTNSFHGTREGYTVTTKIITSGNPLAQYITIQTRNYTLLTLKRIDREHLCDQVLNKASTVGGGLHHCCISRKRDCDIPLTVLVQTKRITNDTVQENQSSQFVRLQLRLIDINDNSPKFSTFKHQTYISEAIKVGTRVQLPLAQDADSNEYGIIRYYLKTQESDTFELVQIPAMHADSQPVESLVHLAPQDGFPSQRMPYIRDMNPSHSAPSQLYLKLLKPLDFETRKAYNYVLIAEDNGSPSLTGQIEIEIIVTDENDNHPVFLNKTFTISVAENAPPGRRLLQLVAHDPDEGKRGRVIYSLADGIVERFGQMSQNDSRPTPFKIDPNSGWLTLNDKLDYERVGQYLLRVIARDDAGHPGFDEAMVNVIVQDVNDVSPIITVEPVVDLNEPRSLGQAKPTAEDTIDVYVKEVIIQEVNARSTHGSYESHASETAALMALISVRDPDEGNGGQFQCGLQQPNTSPTDILTFVGKEGNMVYRISSSTNQNRAVSMVAGPFRLDPLSRTQFELHSLGTFDHERQAIQQTLIVCSDYGEPSLSSTFTINVHVEDVNDNAPKFSQSQYQLSVEENRPIDTRVHKLSAVDNDSGANAELEYFLDATGMEFFKLDPIDGTLYTRTVFDRELRQSYRFHVFAKDKGKPEPMTGTATVEVSVLDVNDNTPEFVGLDSDNCFKFRIAENEPADTHIGILLGSDIDAEENAHLRFRLITTTSQFKLDPNTGELTSAQPLDRERQAEHELSVILTDNGRPPRSATARIVIYVTDVNDNDPIIVFPANGRGNVTVSFREPPGEVVARIEARDPDEGHNALLHYGLVSGNRNAVFRMGSTSAELIIDRELDQSDVGVYTLDILIQDAGVPPKSSQVQMIVRVTDSPARMYSHRFSKSRTVDSTQNFGTLHTGHFRRNDMGTKKDFKESESFQSEGGIISASAILVAIVALSCAIILVLLGLTVYLCGRRGFRLRRARTRRQRPCNGWIPEQVDDLNKPGKLLESSMTVDQSNTVPRTYTDQLMLDPGSGTVLRCPLVASSPAVPLLTANDYRDQNTAQRYSTLNYTGYAACIPLQNRNVTSGQYDTFSGPRFCVSPTHFHNNANINNAIMTDNIEAFRTIGRHSNLKADRKRHANWTRSLKPLENRGSASPASDGSAMPNDDFNLNIYAKQIRTVRSCESLLALRETERNLELTPMVTKYPPMPPEHILLSENHTNADRFRDIHLAQNATKLRRTPCQTGMTMSTFLPHQHHPSPSRQVTKAHHSPSHPGVNNSPKTEVRNYLDDGKQTYSCLLHNMPGFMRLPGTPGLSRVCDPNWVRTKSKTPSGMESENLIDLMDSGTNSNCSQSCSCTVGPDSADQGHPPREAVWSAHEQAEFV